MTKLIAQVPTKVWVNGAPVRIAPGEELPEMSAHDASVLTTSGAAQDAQAAAAAEKAARAQAQQDAADIEAARTQVQRAAQSTRQPDAGKKPAGK